MSKPANEASKFLDAMRQIVSVPKIEIDRREAQYRKARAAKKAAKPV